MPSPVTLVALMSIIGSAVAQLPPGIPTCAQNCIGTSFGGCQTLDVKCICGNHDLISQLSCCISQGCDAADQQTSVAFANKICAPYNVELPQSASCASGTTPTPAPGSSSSSAASSASSAASSVSSAISSSLSSVTATSIGGIHNATSTGAGATGASGSGSGSGSATGSGSGSGSGSSSSATAASSAGAGRVEGGLFGAAGLVLGGLAML